MNKRLAYRLSAVLREALNRACREQHRSQSAQAAFYIVHGLKKDGYIQTTESSDLERDE